MICRDCGRKARALRNKRTTRYRRCSCGSKRTTSNSVVQYGLWLKVSREVIADMRSGAQLEFIGYSAEHMARSLARAVTLAGCGITTEVDVQVLLKEAGPVSDPTFPYATLGVKCSAKWIHIHDRPVQENIVSTALTHLLNRKMKELIQCKDR